MMVQLFVLSLIRISLLLVRISMDTELINLNLVTLILDQVLLFVRFSILDCPFRLHQFYGFLDYKYHFVLLL